jgi:hypothetical protein
MLMKGNPAECMAKRGIHAIKDRMHMKRQWGLNWWGKEGAMRE